MARVWRDGQKKTVHIYRLLTTVITSKLSVCYVLSDVSSKNNKDQREHFNISTLALQTAVITSDSLIVIRYFLHFCLKFDNADRTFLHLALLIKKSEVPR